MFYVRDIAKLRIICEISLYPSEKADLIINFHVGLSFCSCKGGV